LLGCQNASNAAALRSAVLHSGGRRTTYNRDRLFLILGLRLHGQPTSKRQYRVKKEMSATPESRHPHLSALLKDRLAAIGLDYDTYSPYILGLFAEGGQDEDSGSGDELADVVSLLKESSEEDFEDVDDRNDWAEEFASSIRKATRRDAELRKKEEKAKIDSERRKMEEQFAQAKLEQRHQQEEKPASAIDDATKRKLIERYAYEEDMGSSPGGGGEGGGAVANDTPKSSGEPALRNRRAAAQVRSEQAREPRSSKQAVQTKKDERQKTKEQKLSKERLKEQRRKRATKGERKR